MTASLGTALPHHAAAPLARCHPLARIAATAILMLALFATLDTRASAIALAAVVAFAAASGLRPGPLIRRAAPLGFAAVGIGVFNGLAAQDAAAGLAVALRLAAVALAGMVAVATIEATELADALVQHLRAPARFAVGTLAAFRLLPLFAREWDVRGRARRARGIESERGLVARLGGFPDRILGLLVGAIRRATVLALAMDARGFGSRPCRTISRPRAFTRRDVVLLAIAGVVSAAVLLSARAGA